MFKKKKRNDKGSTLIMVIVSLGFIGIMVSLILIISSNNIYTKLVDKKSKNNFYSVENVLDQVEKGIQSSMSRHMVKAYYKVLSEYNNQEASTYSEKFKKLTMEGIPGDTTAKGFKQEMCDGESYVKVSSITAYLDDELKALVGSTDTANCL
ncbi:MAG: hypothetical protein K6G26_09280, partial [Lachnospiraceae bacterium]|nr:hypothetical protein [Lachnospiraceae bacterium]